MEITALVLSAIALVLSAMALPTLFQMFWGSPKVRTRVSKEYTEGSPSLIVHIFSPGIESKVLRRLNVKREQAHVTAAFTITEAGTNRIVVEGRVPELSTAVTCATEVSLSSMHSAVFPIVIRYDGETKVCGTEGESLPVLEAPRYRAEVIVNFGHDDLFVFQMDFRNDNDDIEWIDGTEAALDARR